MKIITLLILLVLTFFGLRLAVAWASSTPATAGVADNHLGPCPSTPNCVNSADRDTEQAIDALIPANAMTITAVAELLETQPRTKVVTQSENYLHATIRSSLWGFIDDLEIFLTDSGASLQVRSASRLGVSDLGENRKRVENLRRILKTQNQ